MLGVDDVWGEAVTKKVQFYINMKQMSCFFSRYLGIVFPLTGARDGSEHIFVQAGVQEGARPGRRHQGVGKKRIFSSILKKKTKKTGQQFNAHKPTYCTDRFGMVTSEKFSDMVTYYRLKM